MPLRQTPLQPQARICLLYVIARSKATRQSVSPQKCLTNRCCMGEFVVGSVFAQSIAFRFVLPQENGLPRLVAPKSAMLPAGQRPAGEQRSLRAPLPAKGAPLRGPQHWLAMTCRNLPGGYVCKNVVPGKFAGGSAFAESVLVLAKAPPSLACHCVKRPCNPRRVSVFCMSLRGAKRRGNPFPRRNA